MKLSVEIDSENDAMSTPEIIRILNVLGDRMRPEQNGMEGKLYDIHGNSIGVFNFQS